MSSPTSSRAPIHFVRTAWPRANEESRFPWPRCLLARGIRQPARATSNAQDRSCVRHRVLLSGSIADYSAIFPPVRSAEQGYNCLERQGSHHKHRGAHPQTQGGRIYYWQNRLARCRQLRKIVFYRSAAFVGPMAGSRQMPGQGIVRARRSA